jgi:CBS domain-containing protein
MGKFVKDLIEVKNKGVWVVEPTASVYDAIAQMADKQIGALLVTENSKVIGIITERDYARKVVLRGKSSKNTSVSKIMTERVIFVQPEQPIEECMALMTENRIRHLPVLENGKLIGMVSIGDIVKAVISEKDLLIDQLSNYISGY